MFAEVADTLNVVRVSGCDRQFRLSVRVLDVPQFDGSLVGTRDEMPVVGRKIEAVDTIGVSAILSQHKFILELEKLDSTRSLSHQEQVAILPELESCCRVVELEQLLSWLHTVIVLKVYGALG